MKAKKHTNLSWNDRHALIDHFRPSDNMICSALGVSTEELDTARQMKASGAFVPTTDLDFSAYSGLFSSTNSNSSSSAVSIMNPKNQAPLSATKPQKVSRPRGCPGTKINRAYQALPFDFTPLAEYAETHDGVSVHCLKQSDRFDKFKELGRVRTKTVDGVLMIKRDQPITQD